jgi:E1A-binding protein p400
MLDILEVAFSLYNFTYVRLDGATKTEFRQPLVEYFNNNPKLFLFISSTRSGGIGLNLTSADTVIFYDSDWNPAIDRQAQVPARHPGQVPPHRTDQRRHDLPTHQRAHH